MFVLNLHVEGSIRAKVDVEGITGQGGQNNNQGGCNPLGLGLNLGALPMNPALVAAALNQASWGLIGNLQNQPEPNFNQGFSNGPNNNTGKTLNSLIFDGFVLKIVSVFFKLLVGNFAGNNQGGGNQGGGGGPGFLNWMSTGGGGPSGGGQEGGQWPARPPPGQNQDKNFLKYD